MPAQRFRKKPVEIDAVRWDGTNWGEVCDFLGVPENGHGDEETLRRDPSRMPVVIHTLEGDMRAELGDWIIKGVRGEFYPCKPDIFDATYEDATSTPTDDVYRERARLVAFLAASHPAVLAFSDPSTPGWAVLTIETPAGQMSWHISPDDLDLFPEALVAHVHPEDPRAKWDGHDTPTKYERLTALTRQTARTAQAEANARKAAETRG